MAVNAVSLSETLGASASVSLTPSASEAKQCIILGAGSPHFGKVPSVLHEPVRGVRVLEWILSALGGKPDRTTVVVGYKANEIRQRYSNLNLVDNPLWEKTGSAMSLFEAPLTKDANAYVCYGDVLFRRTAVEALERVDAPIAIAWDSSWRRGTVRCDESVLQQSEKVVIGADGTVQRAGVDVPHDWASGLFIGLVRFSAQAIEQLEALQKGDPPPSLRQCHLSGLVEWLRGTGIKVVGVDVAGDWVEVEKPADIARFVLGTKAETLNRLRALVTKAVILEQVAFTVADWRQAPQNWVAKIITEFGTRSLAVRSSARSEDSFKSSNAGAYKSLLDVNPHAGLETAINAVIDSYVKPQPVDQVLVQPMLTNVALCGVALTRTLEYGAPYYVVNYDETGATHQVTDGSSRHHKSLIVRRDTPIDGIADERLRALIDALREIEGLLGYDALDVEFAINGAGIVHILQVRPIAVDGTGAAVNDTTLLATLDAASKVWTRLEAAPPHMPRSEPLFGVMPDWNPAEMIGTCPGALADGLYRFLITDDVWATQRAEYGYKDVRPHPLMVSFAGHPYVDVRASFTSFVPASVPDKLTQKLVNFYVSRLRENPHFHDKVEFEVVPTCLSFGFEQWASRLSDANFTDGEVACLREGLQEITSRGILRAEHDLANVAELESRFPRLAEAETLSELDRARLLLNDCRRLGTLPFAHLARGGFIAVTLLRDAVSTGVLSLEAHESFFSTIHSVSQQLVEDARAVSKGTLSWEVFVERYGHLRPGTYDVTSPRYDHDPDRFLRPLLAAFDEPQAQVRQPHAWNREKGAFFRALSELGLSISSELAERFMREAIEGRELAKFIFSRCLSAALEALTRYGESLGLSREDLSHVSLHDLLLPPDYHGDSAAHRERLLLAAEHGRQRHRIALACELPSLLTSRRDFVTFSRGAETPNFIGSKRVTAECHELSGGSAPRSSLSGRLVLVPQADPGYDWIFGHGIAGLITMYGGANSHMAIRAAEFGLPAAIGIGEQRYRQLAQARLLELDPGNGTLRVLQ